MSRNILVRFWHFPVVTLGPGRRLGIWLQGCSIQCEDCIAPENQPFDEAFMMTVDELMKETADALNNADGVTISGGEPLDQKDALQCLLNEINMRGKNDILIYSGYTKNKVLEIFPEISGLVAALISEPFVKGDITSAIWKGSENQILTVFSEQHRGKYEVWSNSTERRLQLVRKDTGSYLLGIPQQDDLTILRG